MKRREFIAGVAGAVASQLTARAQQPERMRRIGVLMSTVADDPETSVNLAAFLQGLEGSGWMLGRNVRIDYRWGGVDAERVRSYATELVALTPDIILARGGTPAAALHWRPVPCRSCSCTSLTRSAAAWSRAWRGRGVARDRGGGYGEAITRALPQATQVADRWHLMENASRAFLDAVRKTMRPIRTAIGATTINPELLTAAERLQYEGYQRREEVNTAVLALAKDKVPIKEIVRRLGHSRQLVRRVIRGERQDIFRTRQSSLDRHLPWLDAQWSSGCRNSADLWRRLKGQGFRGSLRVVTEWATRRRRAERADAENLQRIPSARTIARLMTIGRNSLSKAETVTITAIEAGVPRLVEAREMIAKFQAMVRNKTDTGLAMWIEAARQSLVASFVNGVAKDEAAVLAAITLPWSNGQTEGQITKLEQIPVTLQHSLRV
jgi:transposase